METEGPINYNNWYLGAVADIIGDEALRNYQIFQPLRFLRTAEAHDFKTFDVIGFINYENLIIPIIKIWSDEKATMGNGIPLDICLTCSHLDASDGFILVGRYIWDYYEKKGHKAQTRLFDNLYQFITVFIDAEYFDTMRDDFTVSHIGYKAFKKALFELEDIRGKYRHEKYSECDKVMKYGDRLLYAKNVAQRCGLRIGYWDFGWIYMRNIDKEANEEGNE